MKRVFAALLAILYLSLASGVQVHAHFCMGRLVDAGLAHGATHNNDAGHRCSLCGMDKKAGKKGCCQEEKASFKVAEAQKGAVQFSSVFAPVAELPLPAVWMPGAWAPVSCGLQDVLRAHEPPDRVPALPIFLRVRSLRI